MWPPIQPAGVASALSMPNPWANLDRMPPGPAAALAALHLTDPRMPRLDDPQWRAALDFCDRSQITLPLRNAARDAMPAWVRERTDRNLADNVARLQRLLALYHDIAGKLVGIEYVALKGLTHCELFGSRPEERPQYDVDIYCPPENVAEAYQRLQTLGLEPIEGRDKGYSDHLPPLIRRTGWQYAGNVFDPEMPLSVEVHFRFWNGEAERLPVDGVQQFWDRRTVRPLLGLPALCQQDTLAFACMHLLKHVLRGGARPFHAYELARFLQLHAADEDFWRQWKALPSPELRRLQAVCFRLASDWFGCALGPAADEVSQLPRSTRAWFDRFALSPALAPFNSNKDELWLHASLVHSRRDAMAIVGRRLFPRSIPAAVDSVYTPPRQMTLRRRLRKHFLWARFAAGRAVYHAASFPQVVQSGLRWWNTQRRHW